ncbi:MAG: hypothetical protein KDB02_03165 [Acidimicrobiales bacterium]|nr:hypothetical protein [Acidimicrobiales bacterium]
MNPNSLPSSRIATLSSVLIALATVALLALDHGALATPKISKAGATTWLDSSDPVTVAMTVFRLLALLVALHLLSTMALAAAGRTLKRQGLARFATAVSLPPMRGVVIRIAGLGLSASILMSSPTAVAAAEPAAAEASGHSAVLRLAPPPEPTGQATLVERVEDPPPSPAPRTEQRHVALPGDHLWLIAEQRLGEALGRSASDAEIGPYWQRVVEANPQLKDPDLLFPGDEVIVPEP